MDSRISRPVPSRSTLVENFLSALPFELSGSQMRALGEIGEDMERTTPMHRLLQGEVGSGKTIVAYAAMLRAAAAGRQAVLMSGYLGSIGFGYPAALGAWAATRAHRLSRDLHWRQFADRPVICVTGDGGFGQYAWEVNTAVRHRMNITHVLLNNNELGKISKEQRAGQWSVWQTSLTNPNIAAYVSSCGGLGIRVEQATELAAALERALAYDGPATVEVMTDVELV